MAMKTFVPVRYRFLSAMRFPQATTVLVEGLPDSLCSDLRGLDGWNGGSEVGW